MTFTEFIQSRRVTDTPSGDFIVDTAAKQAFRAAWDRRPKASGKS
jgi:hypothetical protein